MDTLQLNNKNPRFIKYSKFEALVISVQTFPEMMELRPLVVDEDNKILAGNMRYRALQEIGTTAIPDTWVKRALNLTPDQKKEFLIKDNLPYGEWDWDILADEWDQVELATWGMDLPIYPDNTPGGIDEHPESLVIKLNYTPNEYYLVNAALQKIGPTPEAAVIKLLENWASLNMIPNHATHD